MTHQIAARRKQQALRLRVSVATTYWGSLPELVEVLTLASAGKLHTRIEQFPLSRAVEAYEALLAGTLQGRAVIVP